MKPWNEPVPVEKLKARLLPAGTRLKDASPEHRGLTWAEYLQVERAEERTRLEALRAAETEEPDLSKKPVSTSRDSYGWRSLPAGTRFLGFK